MKKQFNELIERELSRKDFLKFVGGGIIALLGMSNFIKYLLEFQKTSPKEVADSSHGFGSRKFGA